MANELVIYQSNSNDQWTVRDTSYSLAGLTYIGKESDGDVFKCAMRFPSVGIAQGTTVDHASLYFYTEYKGAGSSNLKFKTYGIDEDNTATFSSDPTGRSKTSASDTSDNAMPSVGQYKQITVTSIVNEILARGGWSSGNAIGFILEDDGSSSDVFIGEVSPADSYLIIRESALPDFTPTPKTVSAPTLPATGNFGMKFAPSGVNALTATDTELLSTTRKYQYKIVAQDQTACTGGVLKQIAHGLDHIPQIMCFVRKNGLSFQLPRLFDGASDPVGGGVQGWVAVDDTYLYAMLFTSADLYYYIFLDEQAN